MKNLTELIAKYGDKEIDETKFKEVFDIKDSKVFIPKEGERSWFVDEFGNAFDLIRECYASGHDKLIKYNIVYRTKEEAEFARDKRAFMVQMERDFAENSDEIDWNDINQKKHFMYCNHDSEFLEIFFAFVHQHSDVLYTTNRKWLEQYIKDNEADIKKYVFGIKEDK